MSQALKQNLNPARNCTLEELLKALVAEGALDAEQAQQIRNTPHSQKMHPLVVLSEKKLSIAGKPLTLEMLTQWLSHYSELPYYKIDTLKIDVETVTSVVSEAYAKRYKLLPVSVDKEKVIFATSEPLNLNWMTELQRVLKRKIEVVVANPLEIQTCLKEFYTVHNAIRKLNSNSGKKSVTQRYLREGKVGELDKLIEKGRHKNLNSEDSAVVQIVDWLLQFASDERASDIHLEPKRGMSLVRFRVDGSLRTVYRLDPDVFLPVISRFKVLGHMKVDEKRKPQDGRIKRFLSDSQVMELRLSTIPTPFGEKLVIRIFDPEMTKKSFSDLGFYKEDLSTWQKLISHSNGIVLVTGPTGSGKTTTLYSSLNELATPDVNICTAEDPVEMISDRFNQMQINPHIDITFSNAVRHFLRQDPDVIMVGEIRDLETAEMAVQASLTGHLVFSTLHTNSAMASVVRLLDLGLPSFLINATIRGIMAQRLIKVLCPHCKEESRLEENEWETLVKDLSKVVRPEKVYRPVGCDECKQQGFKGRMAIYELIVFDDEIRSEIKPNVAIHELVAKLKHRYEEMRYNGAKRVVEGLTTVEEVLKVVI